MGRIKPSPEAIDLHMDVGEKLIKRIKDQMLSVVTEDLFYATLNPAQATLMLYGIPPPTPKECIKLLDEIFVKKEKLLEKKYVDILERMYKLRKNIEHGKVKDITGKEVDKLLSDLDDYLKRINKLFNTIEKRAEGKRVVEFYDACMAIAKDVLAMEKIKGDVVKGFTKLVKGGKISERFLNILKLVIKSKKEYDSKKISKQEIEKVRKESAIFVQGMLELIQRKRGLDIDRLKLRIKYGSNKFAEVYLMDKEIYLIPDLDAKPKIYQKGGLSKDGKISEVKMISFEDFEKGLSDLNKMRSVDINKNLMNHLMDLFGNDMVIVV